MSAVLRTLPVPEIVIPRQGEQSPVVIISYMGYSPSKCTCHGKQSHPSNYMNLLECLHDQSHVPSPHRLPHICLSRMRVKYPVFKTKTFCSQKLTIEFPVNTLDYPPRRIAGYFSETVMVLIRSNLLDNSPRQFFGKYSFKFLSQTFLFLFQFHVMHSLLIF